MSSVSTGMDDLWRIKCELSNISGILGNQQSKRWYIKLNIKIIFLDVIYDTESWMTKFSLLDWNQKTMKWPIM